MPEASRSELTEERSTHPANRKSGDTFIYVVGMHRSGTSAATGLLCHLGIGEPKEEQRLRATKNNERGFWEAKSLNLFDERLLTHLGGRWCAPPALEPGWEKD